MARFINEKILIVSASVGAGHNQAAKAVAGAIKSLHSGCRVEVVDFMAEESSFLNSLIKKTYLMMLEVSPGVYDFLYRWSQPESRHPKVRNILAAIMKRSMLDLYQKHKPDIIVFTHPFACGAAACLRRDGVIDVPLAAVITDFSIHELWIYEEVDLYFVAAPELMRQLIKREVRPDRVRISGIPIDGSFAKRPEKTAVAGHFAIDTALPIVLIMAGGLGTGPVEEILAGLDNCGKNLQLIVVAGKNQILYNRLLRSAEDAVNRVSVFGFTQRIRDLMALADILVTKPGGLTVSEALAMSLPVVLYGALPGQEQENTEFLLAHGAVEKADNENELVETVTNLLAQPELLDELRLKAAKMGCPSAAWVVAGAVLNYCGNGRKSAAGF